ncbi:MAG: hypothetical protein V3T59_09435, partial [Desulfobacterales bacterium]
KIFTDILPNAAFVSAGAFYSCLHGTFTFFINIGLPCAFFFQNTLRFILCNICWSLIFSKDSTIGSYDLPILSTIHLWVRAERFSPIE